MHYILFDGIERDQLLPFTYTRPVADIRCGILTMRERWELLLQATTLTLAAAELQPDFPHTTTEGQSVYLNGAVFANDALVAAVAAMDNETCLKNADNIIAVKTEVTYTNTSDLLSAAGSLAAAPYAEQVNCLKRPWDIFVQNEKAINEDFALVTSGRESAALPEGVIVAGKQQIFIEEGATIGAGCVINATTGPVYIGKDASLLEGVLVRGPLAMCEHSVVKMGAKIYGATTLGPGCKVGGEINNTVFFANSNKAHDGYLGNAVIGEWCNLGADTNCSNLKNNYGVVKAYDIASGRDVSTGLIFCGLMMGDHSKCGINTMFNTGTVVGVSCNIYGGGFPDKYIPSFSWGGADGMTVYTFDKAIETANRMMGRRGKQLSVGATAVLREVYEQRAGTK